jgi:hypothetical protein
MITEAMHDNDDDERAQIMMCRESWLAYEKKLSYREDPMAPVYRDRGRE